MTAVLLGDLNMLRCFAALDPGVDDVVVATSDEAVRSSRFARRCVTIAPWTEPERAVADLVALAHDLPEPRVLFYGDDRQLLAISRHRAQLAPLYRFQMPPADLVEILVDKIRFGRHAEAVGLPLPATLSSRDIASVDHAIARITPPYLIKPATHIGWYGYPRKALVLETAEALRAVYDEVRAHTADFVIQQYIPGGEDRIYSFHAYVDSSGATLGRFAGKKLRTYPREAGVSTYLELVDEPRVLELGAEAIDKLGLTGPMKLDFKMHPETGELVLLEVNARFNLWHHLGAACGVNLPLVAYRDLTGAPILAPDDYATDVRWLAFGDDLRSYLRDYRAAGLGLGDWLRSLRGKKVFDVFAWNDPLPWARTMLAQLASRMR